MTSCESVVASVDRGSWREGFRETERKKSDDGAEAGAQHVLRLLVKLAAYGIFAVALAA